MQNVITENLKQLANLLEKIPVEAYQKKIDILSGSSIGQHMRHILEFYQIVVEAQKNTLSYDNRKRELIIQEDPKVALARIASISESLLNTDNDREINLDADFTSSGEKTQHLKSSIGREIAYCIEHSIHHQALIKAGLIALNLKHLVSEDFGVAYSTIRYNKKVCAQ